MKKTKILVATLTAAAITVSCGALAACNKNGGDGGEENPPATATYEVTFDANGGSWVNNATTQKLTTGTDGKLTALPNPDPTYDGYEFVNYNTKQDGTGSEVTVSTVYTANTTVYALWNENELDPGPDTPTTEPEHTITLVVGNGVLPSGAVTTFKTGDDGKIIGTLPEPTIATAHWSFGDWYDAETGGNAIVEATTVFKKDTTIYARYVRDNGVWNGDGTEYIHELILNSGSTDKTEYWLGLNNKIALTEGDVVTLYMNGELVSYYDDGSNAIEKPAEGVKATTTTITVSGDFAIYLRIYPDNPNNYCCQFAGPTKVEVGSEVPAGCEAITITFKTAATDEEALGTITLYIVGFDGNPVGADDISSLNLHYWGVGTSSTSWPGVALSKEMTIVGGAPNANSGWIINKTGGGQTEDLNGTFLLGKTYLVKVKTGTQPATLITEIVLEAAE